MMAHDLTKVTGLNGSIDANQRCQLSGYMVIKVDRFLHKLVQHQYPNKS